jgi:hypothetical protein
MLGHFPVSNRVAYDPSRGRLWAVCVGCGRWNLAPIEERWEALEEIDKLVTDKGRLLAQTDNIALAKAGEMDVVRVGRANLNEEAWWRYGRELRERRAIHKRLGYVESAAMLALAATGFGVAIFIGGRNGLLTTGARWLKYGNTAWRGETSCRTCGALLESISFREARHLIVLPGEADAVSLQMQCGACRRASEGFRLNDVQSQHLLRRILAHSHYAGASEKRLKGATNLIEEIGSSAALTQRIARNRPTIATLTAASLRTESIALEIAINDENERRLLELELEELEKRWREEEEIADIVDRELTPLPIVNRFLGLRA